MNWFIARLKEPSTWRGIVWILTVLGLSLRPDQTEAIIAVGMALAGLLGVFLADEPKNVRIALPPIALQGRSEPSDAGAGVDAGRPAAELQQSMSPGFNLGASTTTDPNTYPNLNAVGWGDRD